MTKLNDREHCFHSSDAIVLDMLPPIYSRTCCHCGYSQRTEPVFPKGHGDHVLVEPYSEYPEPDPRWCEPKPAEKRPGPDWMYAEPVKGAIVIDDAEAFNKREITNLDDIKLPSAIHGDPDGEISNG